MRQRSNPTTGGTKMGVSYCCLFLLVLHSQFHENDAFASFLTPPSLQKNIETTKNIIPYEGRHVRPTSSKFAFLKKHMSSSASSKSPVLLSAKGKEVEEEEYEEYDEEEDEEYEYEYEYEEYEEEVEEDEENEDEENEEEEEEEEEHIPLQDDTNDPHYTAHKKIIEERVERSVALNKMKERTTGENTEDFFRKNIEQLMDQEIEKAGKTKEVEALFQKLKISEGEEADITSTMEEAAEGEETMSDSQQKAAFLEGLGIDSTEAYPPDDELLLTSTKGAIQNEDLQNLESALKDLTGKVQGYYDNSQIDNKQATIRPQYELEHLDQQTLDEISMCLNASSTDANGNEYAETIKAEDPLRWLLYDLDFNVSNLMLASCKFNPESPLLLNHWMPQLCTYSRYAEAREQKFQFTWEDCENADVDELHRYFKGLGYENGAPKVQPKDTNIVDLDMEYDQEDMTMAAFENWMNEVYNEADEHLYFDDEDFQPENNVFDRNYGMDDTDEVTAFRAEFSDFQAEHANETQQWKDRYAKETNYTVVDDKEAAEEFRGHLVVACCGSDKDLELAERITDRMSEEFGKKVHTETRVYSHARQEDNLYEIWIESYDIELLHSRRGAFYNNKQWNGPADVDDEQLENLVEKVRYIISDDARYSYHIHEFVTEV